MFWLCDRSSNLEQTVVFVWCMAARSSIRNSFYGDFNSNYSSRWFIFWSLPHRAVTMLLSFNRLKQNVSKLVTYVNNHSRILFFVLFLLPLSAYILAWILCTTETFFPRPLRQANEVLIVVAHPDDECILPCSDYADVALFFSPSILRTLRSGQGQGNMLVLSPGCPPKFWLM